MNINFSEALLLLKESKKVKRMFWKEHLLWLPTETLMSRIEDDLPNPTGYLVKGHTGSYRLYNPTQEDLLSDDWYLLNPIEDNILP